MDPVPISVRRFDDYVPKLEAANVVLDADRRKDIILHDARDRAFALGLELVEDEGLLEEVAGLVEWPVVLVGEFDAAFLDIPPEVIRTTIRANQKCFVLRDQKSGKLANRFILVANIEASDGGKAIVEGNERVIRARLSDARYFWETDLKTLPARDTRPRCRSSNATSSSTRSWARRASASIASCASRARSRRWSAPTRRRPRAPPSSRRPTSSPRWSANSPSCRASWGNTTR